MSFAEAGGVVLERNLEFGLVDLETAEAVRVGEFAERAELIVCERGLKFEFGFEERHERIIAKRGRRGGRDTASVERVYARGWNRREISPLHNAARKHRDAPLGLARGKRESRAVPAEMTDDLWRCGWCVCPGRGAGRLVAFAE